MSTTTTTRATMADQFTPPYTVNDYPAPTFITSNPTSPQRTTFGAANHPSAIRQIHPPKSPLYVPAVLRPTEIPSRRPLTPPRSLHSSTDSLSRNNNTRPIAIPPQPISIMTTLTRQSTASSGPSTPNSVQPTKAHWKKDADVTHCEAPGCAVAFGLISRRHHCRCCGGIFCSSHAGAQVPLNEEAEIDENGSYHRACDNCFSEWDGYSRNLVTGKLTKVKANQDRNSAKAVPGSGNKNASDASGSVPKDWSWSTF